jgi:phenylalanyl-tRNA synthetase alpha chain
LAAHLAAVAAAPSSADLEELRVRLLGRRSEVSASAGAMGTVDPAARPELGRRLSALRGALEEALAARAGVLAEAERVVRLESERVDLSLPGRRRRRGYEHLITRTTREVEDLFVGMGYRVAEGPEVETDWYCFEALNIPRIHPARSMQDTLYVESPAGEDEVLLRTHTSAVQVRYMESHDPPVYIISPGRVARREEVSAKNGAIFHQFEGLVVDRGVSFGDLAGTVEYMARALFGKEREIRLRPSFFPYTEPSAELDVSCFICGGEGGDCRTCQGEGWIEIGGSGVIHPQVLRNVGYDPEEVQGFAFGMGIERIAMLRHGIPDLRMFWDNDLRVLEQF